ncbi:DUF6708 domain-containing protein [Burkholderia sp. LMU1-1-1.1]|uniref:DUF6708 domain-containing protein n=1 Tax=Burkholderia sp. LMU1-1-1.1 TaxID=3135266 RepID=UPI003434A184
MDERFFSAKLGCPIPEWDSQHRLPLHEPVGPDVKDSATIFRINSIYMDVSDQPHLMRQWYAGATLTACLFTAICSYGPYMVLVSHRAKYFDFAAIAGTVIFIVLPFFFASLAIYSGRDEFFWLKRRPIRFNRITKKIYAVRHRRHRNAELEGDICWEVPWDERSVFCIHRGPVKLDLGEHYHIRYYQLDEKENVVRSFAVGREWQGIDGMSDLLAQWNFWCTYMNKGPEGLPPPLLFLSERENLLESFLCCLHELGLDLVPRVRAIFSPFAALLTTYRAVAMFTCRDPIWPAAVLELSDIEISDFHAQPRGGTPIGFAATARARREGRYPLAPCCVTPDWSGESDSIINARRWMHDSTLLTAVRG